MVALIGTGTAVVVLIGTGTVLVCTTSPTTSDGVAETDTVGTAAAVDIMVAGGVEDAAAIAITGGMLFN